MTYSVTGTEITCSLSLPSPCDFTHLKSCNVTTGDCTVILLWQSTIKFKSIMSRQPIHCYKIKKVSHYDSTAIDKIELIQKSVLFNRFDLVNLLKW